MCDCVLHGRKERRVERCVGANSPGKALLRVQRIWLTDCMSRQPRNRDRKCRNPPPLPFRRAQRPQRKVYVGSVLRQPACFGGQIIIGPPSAAGTGSKLAATKVPSITAVRTAILIASFAFTFFIVVLLWDLGFSCSADPSQVTLVMHSSLQTSHLVLPHVRVSVLP